MDSSRKRGDRLQEIRDIASRAQQQQGHSWYWLDGGQTEKILLCEPDREAESPRGGLPSALGLCAITQVARIGWVT